MDISEFNILDMLQPELAILIPVCWGIGKTIKSTKINNKYIPLILSLCSVSLSTLYTFAIRGTENIAMSVFMSITQGIGYWAAAWLSYEKIIKPIYKKNKTKNCKEKTDDKESLEE